MVNHTRMGSGRTLDKILAVSSGALRRLAAHLKITMAD